MLKTALMLTIAGLVGIPANGAGQEEKATVLQAVATHVQTQHAEKRIAVDPRRIDPEGRCAGEHTCPYARGRHHAAVTSFTKTMSARAHRPVAMVACAEASIYECDLSEFDVVLAFSDARRDGERWSVQVAIWNTGNDGSGRWGRYFEVREVTVERAERGSWTVVEDKRLFIT
jgi:hypothetical protein